VGRVNRLTERRALRRAADQALLTSLTSVPSRGAPDQHFQYTRYTTAVPAEIAPSYDHEPATEPIPVVGEPVTDSASVAPAPALDFVASGYRGRSWYRTKPAAIVLAAVTITALLGAGWLVLRSPSSTAENSSTEATTGAPPAPTSARPAPMNGATPPPPAPSAPPPPPPPSPAGPAYSPSQRQYQPRYTAPSPAEKPRVDVTRAPMSVAPVPRSIPGNDSSTPGDAPDRDGPRRRRGCFGFC
jgi:hypothetical protein